jgi:pentapeptide MXKDX repeat protein
MRCSIAVTLSTDKVTADGMSEDEMTVDKMSVDEMIIDKMSEGNDCG